MLSKRTNGGMEPTQCPCHCPYTPHTHFEDLLISENQCTQFFLVYWYGHTYVTELAGKKSIGGFLRVNEPSSRRDSKTRKRKKNRPTFPILKTLLINKCAPEMHSRKTAAQKSGMICVFNLFSLHMTDKGFY